MPTPYIVSKGNVEAGTIIQQPLTVMQNAATAPYTIQLPPGSYEISLTINSSLTGTTSTISAVRPWANEGQTVVTNQDLKVNLPAAASLVGVSVTFPAAAVGKYNYLSSGMFGTNPLQIPYGIRFLVTKGTAVAGERFEVTATAVKRG